MKAEAISDVLSLNYDLGAGYEDKAKRMGDIVSAGALAYILDPDNKATYISKVHDTMVNYWDDLRAGLDGSQHSHTVPPGSAFFESVLALDIMYNDLTLTQRANIEGELQQVADWYYSHSTSWQLNLYGVRGIWAIYKGDRARIDQAKSDYRNRVMLELSDDGVFSSSPNYAGSRFGYERVAKAHFMDVLEFTGEDPNYYSDNTMQAFMEWLYGYSITPFRLSYTFGDSPPNRNRPQNGPGQYRTYRFSETAYKYAAWNNDGTPPRGRLLYYLFLTQPWPEPERAPSRIFKDGGAWFIQAGYSERDLSGALWNCKSATSHAHKDVNAIHLAAYGEHVLRNSGYIASGEGALGFSWDYINNYAPSSNTVLINGSDHVAKKGAGITEGFTASSFDYASGDSGNALPNGHHQRNFVFIHPQDGVNGYWILFDEVDADSSSAQVNVALHPNSNDYTTVSTDREYRWKIGPYTYSGHDVYLSIFLGTAPTSTTIKDGLLAAYSDESFVGKYLYSTYDTDDSGKRNIVTVLFPHDDTHAKANMTRISGPNYSGTSIVQGGSVEDIALESSGNENITYNGFSFRGLAAWHRLEDGSPTSAFVRKGRYLDIGSVPGVGFESSNDVTVYIEGAGGRIISPGTLVKFYYPGIVGVSLNGDPPLPNINSGPGWVQVNIPSGTHEMEFITFPVHNINTGLNYTTIQEAINANETLGGHTIFVEAGTYYEHVVVNKSLTLLGEDRDTTVIDVNGTGDGVTITADNATVTTFTIKSTGTETGIDLSGRSNVTVKDTTVTGFWWGICLDYSGNNTVLGNNATNNYYGIYLESSSNNSIHHNNFINNTNQVYNYQSNNTWDDGYPSGGNYWSNYTGADLYSGPYQNETGGDGIGDTPYEIDANNRDRYPLTLPWPINGMTTIPYNATAAYPGWTVNVTVFLQNRSANPETFNATAYYDSHTMGNQTVEVAPGAREALTFTWNLDGVTPCTYNYTSGEYIPYTIIVNVSSPTLGETTWYDGTVTVRRLGDANGDGHCDGYDFTMLNVCWLMVYPDERYNPNADFNGDGSIDGYDFTHINLNWLTY